MNGPSSGRLAAWVALALAAGVLGSCSEDAKAGAGADADAKASADSTASADVATAPDTAAADAAPEDVQFAPLTKGIWTQIKVPADPNVSLHGVWTDGPTRIVAAGTNGTILQNDGLGWQVVSQGKFPTLNGVAGGAGAGHTFAVGGGGTIVGATGSDGTPGTHWGPPGGCTKPADCDDKDPCTADACEAGVCSHEPSGGSLCCGGIHFADGFDKGLGSWTVADLQPPPEGGIVWKAAKMTGKDGGKRATSPPNAAYFGLTDVPCDGGDGFCGTFDNGHVVASTMLSPEFKLPKAGKITINFQLFADVESGYFDQLRVSVQTQLGGKEIVWDKQAALNSGTTGGKFAPIAIDVTKFQGQAIRLEILFNSLSKNSNSGEGVFIDDFSVSSECAPPVSGAKSLTKGTLFGVWAAANDDAWAVGEAGFTAHWDGTGWTAVSGGGKLRDLWGMAGTPKAGLAVGEQGLSGTMAGGGFKIGNVGADKTFKAVAVLPDAAGGIGEALAVGSQGAVAHFAGGAWKPETPPQIIGQELTGAAAYPDGTFFVTSLSGQIWQRSADGAFKAAVSVGKPLMAIAATGSDTGWAVGKFGALVERQGGTWKATPTQLNGSANAIYAADHDNVIAVGDGGMAFVRTGGSEWQTQFTATSVNLQGVWGPSPNSVYAVGLLASIVHYDGQEWKSMTGPAGVDWHCVWGTSDSDVWAGGSNGAVAHFDGKDWKMLVEPVTANLRAVWGLSGSDLWAVGENGSIYHGNGVGWQHTEIEKFQPDPEQKPYEVKSHLLAVWGAASNDVWASGEPDDKNHGVIVHWNGEKWQYATILYDLPRTIRAIWGFSATNILLAGTQGTVMQLDGKAGSVGLLEVPTIATLFSMAPFGKDVLVVGDIGTVLRYTPPPAPPKKPDK